MQFDWRASILPLGILWACGGSSNGDGGADGDSSTTGADTTMTVGGDVGATLGDATSGQDTGTGSSDATSTTAGSEGTASGGSTTADTASESSAGSSGSGDAGDEDPEESSSSTSGYDEEASGSTMDCPSAVVNFTPQIPTVVLLIDQSSSMNEDFGDDSRWDAVRDALIEPGAVIDSLQDRVRFGLALYSSRNGFSGGECPLLTEVAPAVDNLAAIDEVYSDADPIDETPTGDSLVAVTADLVALDVDGPKVIVLATDGEPDTCEVPNPQQGQQQSIDAVTAAFEAGIRTFVISVGNEVGEDHLQDLANAGVGWEDGDPQAEYYVPADQDAMIAAFSGIIDGVRDCILTLDTAILPGQADRGTVTVNGDAIPFDDPDGWRVNSSTEIELTGAACDLIQGGDVDVVVEFTCEALVPT